VATYVLPRLRKSPRGTRSNTTFQVKAVPTMKEEGMLEQLRGMVGRAIGNIENLRALNNVDRLYAYDDGRYDAYVIVMGWIDMLEKEKSNEVRRLQQEN